MTTKGLWVKFTDIFGEDVVEEVTFEGCFSISLFKEAVRNKQDLAIPEKSRITIYEPDGVTRIDVGDNPADYLVGNLRNNPLVVKIGDAVIGKIAMTEPPNEALARYQLIASYLQDHDAVKQVCERLKEITTCFSDYECPFVFLEGSSGTGKTQMAFNIISKLGENRKIFYFLFSPPGQSAQNIYKNFENISNLFKLCYKKDARYYSEGNSPSCKNLAGEELFVYGFIYALLFGESTGDVVVERKRGKDVLERIDSNYAKQNRPIVIIDECVALDGTSWKKVRFIRNCFRSLGLGLVLLGTDSRAANLTDHLSRGDPAVPWCYLFGDYPSSAVDLFELPYATPEWLKSLVAHSRPLFSYFLALEVKKYGVADLDFLLKTVFNTVTGVKKIFGNTHGQLGQLRLFQNAHCDLGDLGNQFESSSLIHSHFAQLAGGKKNILLLSDGCAEHNPNTPWAATSYFPKLENDALLYLLLMGGKYYPAFRLASNTHAPYAHFLLKVTNSEDLRSHILHFNNSIQKSNDGMFLEALFSATVCAASHSNGIQGIGLKDFIYNLIFQLQIGIDGGLENVEVVGFSKLKNIENLKIPFLSPVNQIWPDYFQDIPNSNFGICQRPENKDQVDFWAESNEFGMAGECKDYTRNIDLTVMRKIISRIPRKAKLELVFTRNLQHSYFKNSSSSFAEEFNGSFHSMCSFFKIDASNLKTSLKPIEGLPNHVYEEGCTVIFLAVHENLK
jgi:hypothetical protein